MCVTITRVHISNELYPLRLLFFGVSFDSSLQPPGGQQNLRQKVEIGMMNTIHLQ